MLMLWRRMQCEVEIEILQSQKQYFMTGICFVLWVLCCRQHWRLGLLQRSISINHSARSFPLLQAVCNLSHYASCFDSSVVSRTTLKTKLPARAMFVQPLGDLFQICSLLTSPNVTLSLIPDVFPSVAKHTLLHSFPVCLPACLWIAMV